MLSLVILISVFELSVQQCCFPSQWEGIESGSIATVPAGAKAPVLTSFSYLLSVDYSKHLLSLTGSTTTGSSNTPTRIIRDYTAKLQYSLDTTTNVCTKSVLTEKEIPCLGGNGNNSTVLAQTHIGASGQQLPITAYRGILNGMDTTLSVAEGCIPVGAVYHGTSADGSRVVGSLGFHSITGGISDASVFTVPANCISSPLVSSVVG